MSDEDDWTGKTQQGIAIPDRKPGYDDTLPGTPRRPARPQGLDDDIVTSAPVAALAATSQTSGSVSLSGERIAEPLARELIVQRMAKEDIRLQPDYDFSYGDLLLRLDGYDPVSKIGYQYISHAGDDVVTDFDNAAEQRLAQLDAHGIVHILVIHDHETPDTGEVLRRVQQFLNRVVPTLG